jgi:hypothetical protein
LDRAGDRGAGDVGRVEPDGTVILFGRTEAVVVLRGCPVNVAAVAADLRCIGPCVQVSADSSEGSVIIGIAASPDVAEAELRRQLMARPDTLAYAQPGAVAQQAAVRSGAPAITEAGKAKG